MTTNREVIIVLGGMLLQDSNGNWQTTNFNEAGDNFGVLGDRVRGVAASFLSKGDPNLKIIASGGRGQLQNIENCPPISTVLKEELIELGVNPENIIEEPESNDTYQQLENCLAMCKKLNLSQIGIISNEYHLPRIKAFLEYIPDANLYSIELISAEKVVLDKDPESWKKDIEKAYASEGMKKRISSEKKGIKDLRSGKYKFK